MKKEALGQDKAGKYIFLSDIWPKREEVDKLLKESITPKMYKDRYAQLGGVEGLWGKISVQASKIYEWKNFSTYIQEPSFFVDMPEEVPSLKEIRGARCLVKLGDSITTDHISPAGAIPKASPAAKWLLSKDVNEKDFNSFGSRRGNDQIMTRGTFANIRLRNQLAPGTEGGWTTHVPSGEVMPIYDASVLYKKENIPLIVLAGKEYGTGSSRDWAAKGSYALGCQAIIASSFERIHRSNLVGMGVLPLQFIEGESHESLGLVGKEEFHIHGLEDSIQAKAKLKITADDKEFSVICRLDTPVEIDYYKNGGILHTVLRNFLKEGKN